ncbi:MAG: NAD(P)-dependent dehydrogenase (short-subunit alcohol dehydrogenase family) [Pseudohongiellaceae bacterium]|jgi:NAD(P)-dependent dehydrogenase (short-subunit alcohol dehydrogenase family)
MATVLITGTNRGIGLEFVEQFLAQGDKVIASCRNPADQGALQTLAMNNSSLQLVELDVSSQVSMEALPDRLAGAQIDVFVNNAGIYGPRVGFGELEAGPWAEVFQVNCAAPIILTQLLMENFAKGGDKKLVYLTSKMGSIGDNQGGGSHIYRSSKAALNAAVKSLAIDLSDKGFSVALLHPGWVRTDMGGPNGLIDTKTSVTGLMEVIAGLKPASSGCFLNYDGNVIPW